ncbi:hypothetical protein [Burkholderia territorii]|nr:hypothetical protein [Burkholderia territorii]
MTLHYIVAVAFVVRDAEAGNADASRQAGSLLRLERLKLNAGS